MKRSLGACAPAVLLGGLALLAAGCTGGASTSTAPGPASSAHSGSVSSGPASPGPAVSASPTVSATAASPASAAPSPGSAAAVLAASLAALKAGRAVHVEVATTGSGASITSSDDATADGGRQYITLSDGGQVTILYLGDVGYVRGNEKGLMGIMEVPLNQAERLSGRWIAVHPGQKLGTNSFAEITDGITLAAVAAEITPTAPLTLTAPATVSGQRAIGVQGGAPASQQSPGSARSVLDVATAGSRPLRSTVTAADGSRTSITFSDWGESVPLTPPQHPLSPGAGKPPVLT